MRRRFDMDGSDRDPDFAAAEPRPAAGEHVFVHETGRDHLVWQITRAGRPVVLIDGRFRPLPREDYLPLVAGEP